MLWDIHNLKIIYPPDPILKTVATPVNIVEVKHIELAQAMLKVMREEGGIGLAAVQVGVPLQILVMDLREGESWMMFDPKIIAQSDSLSSLNEGCLSFPSIEVEVLRPSFITVEFTDMHNTRQTLSAEGLLAVCIQHEIDHLHGKTIVDYLSSLKRRFAIKKVHRFLKS